jgi:hypothetical protein
MAMEESIFVDIIGWLGVVELLVAYLLVSIKRMEGDSIGYQVLNLIGAASLIVNSYYYRALPSVGINIVWIGIAIFAIVKKAGKSEG